MNCFKQTNKPKEGESSVPKKKIKYDGGKSKDSNNSYFQRKTKVFAI